MAIRLPVEEMENHYLTNNDMEPAGGYPFSLDSTKRSIRNQNPAWSMIFGAGNYSEREASIGFLLLLRHERSPECRHVSFLAAIWGRVTIDYVQKVTEGVRCLTQLGRTSDRFEELERLARHSQRWKPLHISHVINRRLLGKVRAPQNRFGNRKVGIPMGVTESDRFFCVDGAAGGETDYRGDNAKSNRGRGKGEADRRPTNAPTSGCQETARLYQAGKSLLKPGGNLATPHAPRSGKEVFC